MDPLSLQHQARELLNVIGLLSHCLVIRDASADEMRYWRSEVIVAAGRLQGLYAQGLDRRRLLAEIRSDAGARDGGTPGRVFGRDAGSPTTSLARPVPCLDERDRPNPLRDAALRRERRRCAAATGVRGVADAGGAAIGAGEA